MRTARQPSTGWPLTELLLRDGAVRVYRFHLSCGATPKVAPALNAAIPRLVDYFMVCEKSELGAELRVSTSEWTATRECIASREQRTSADGSQSLLPWRHAGGAAAATQGLLAREARHVRAKFDHVLVRKREAPSEAQVLVRKREAPSGALGPHP